MPLFILKNNIYCKNFVFLSDKKTQDYTKPFYLFWKADNSKCTKGVITLNVIS